MNKSLILQPCTNLQGCFCKQRVDNGTVAFGIMLITGRKNYKFKNAGGFYHAKAESICAYQQF